MANSSPAISKKYCLVVVDATLAAEQKVTCRLGTTCTSWQTLSSMLPHTFDTQLVSSDLIMDGAAAFGSDGFTEVVVVAAVVVLGDATMTLWAVEAVVFEDETLVVFRLALAP